MTNCTQGLIEFPAVKRRKVQAQFSGGEITSDGGVLLLRQIDRQLGLLEAVDKVIPDSRDPRYIQHSQLSLLRQRIYGLCLGYEGLNDHESIRLDPAIQSAVDQDNELGSAPTLCRLENRADRQMAIDLHEVMVNQFIDSYKRPPKKLTLDFDATDDRVHGGQAGRFFHGYYVGTIRLKLLKIGGVIIQNTHRIRFLLSSHYPYQDLFHTVVSKLTPG